MIAENSNRDRVVNSQALIDVMVVKKGAESSEPVSEFHPAKNSVF
jgi:hypothetical protein